MPSTSKKPRKTGPTKPKASRLRKGKGTGRRTSRKGLTILHSCGHKQSHVIPGPKWKKEKELQYQKGLACTACWATKKAEEDELLCDQPGMPVLEGTPNRMLWARSLRAILVSRVKGDAGCLDRERMGKGLPPVRDRYLELVLTPLLAQTEASWWVDHRDGSPLDELLDFKAQEELEAFRRETEQVLVCPF